VFLRVIFSNRDDRAPFGSLSEILDSFDYEILGERDLAVQLAVARDMMLLNNARFSLQNNKKTGQQSFSAFFPAYDQPFDADLDDVPYVVTEDPAPTPVLMNLRADLHQQLDYLSSQDADPDALGESEPDAVIAQHSVPETKPLSISREMVERIEQRLKAIQVIDEEIATPTPAPSRSRPASKARRNNNHNGKRDDSHKDAPTPFGW
jgi:hypothetical protein